MRIATLAADRAVHRAFGWLHLHELRLRQWQMEMLAIPAPPFGEQSRAEWFLARFEQLGLESEIDAEGNVLGLLRGENSGRCVLLSAHLDTVFPLSTECRPCEDGARIVGPGACDNGAGLAALLGLIAALRLANQRLPCSIVFCANVGEEGEGNLRGMRSLFREGSVWRPRIAAAIALEGAGEAMVVDRALGSRRFRLTVRGPGGHSWADAAQANPIFALSEALSAVGRIALPFAPRTTLHAGTVEGGTAINAVLQQASATLDLRSVSEAQLASTAETVELAVRSAIVTYEARLQPHTPLEVTFELIGHRPAAALAADAPLLDSLRAVDRHLGIVTASRIGSTDANLPLSLGIPALAIGAGGTGGGIHTLAEWYDPTGRELALRRVLLLLLDAVTLAAQSAMGSPATS